MEEQDCCNAKFLHKALRRRAFWQYLHCLSLQLAWLTNVFGSISGFGPSPGALSCHMYCCLNWRRLCWKGFLLSISKMYRRGWEARNASCGVFGCQDKRGSAQEDELRIEGHAGQGVIGNSSQSASWQLSTGELIPTRCNTIASVTHSKQSVLIENRLSRIISILTKCKSSHRAQNKKILLKGAMAHPGEWQRIRE